MKVPNVVGAGKCSTIFLASQKDPKNITFCLDYDL